MITIIHYQNRILPLKTLLQFSKHQKLNSINVEGKNDVISQLINLLHNKEKSTFNDKDKQNIEIFFYEKQHHQL